MGFGPQQILGSFLRFLIMGTVSTRVYSLTLCHPPLSCCTCVPANVLALLESASTPLLSLINTSFHICPPWLTFLAFEAVIPAQLETLSQGGTWTQHLRRMNCSRPDGSILLCNKKSIFVIKCHLYVPLAKFCAMLILTHPLWWEECQYWWT